MLALHAASLCEKDNLALAKAQSETKRIQHNRRGKWLNAQLSKFRLLLF